MAVAERCLLSREAHPKDHDIPARNTGSQESYLWQRAERKTKTGQTTRQEREVISGRPVFAVNRFTIQSVWIIFYIPPVGAAGRLDNILYPISRSDCTFGQYSVYRQSERLGVWTIFCIPSVGAAGRLDKVFCIPPVGATGDLIFPAPEYIRGDL